MAAPALIEGEDGVLYLKPKKEDLIREACRRSHEFLCRYDQKAWTWDAPLQSALFHAFRSVLNSPEGEGQYLAIEVPIRHGKSECITVRGAAWAMLQKGAKVLVACNTKNLAERFSRKIKEVLRKLGVPPGEVDGVTNWDTPWGSSIFCVGAGGAIEGMGFDYVFIDDIIRSRKEAESPVVLQARWEWLTDSLWGRLEPGAKVWFIMSRWHEEDPLGRIKAGEWLSDEWNFITLKAIAEEDDPLGREEGEALFPQRWPIEKLLKLREANPANFESRYQQNPVPKTGDIFQTNMIRYGSEALIKEHWKSVISLDLGYGETGDYTALVQTWLTDEKEYVARINLCRLEAGKRNKWIVSHCKGKGVKVLIPQDGGAGKESARTLAKALQAVGVSVIVSPVRGGDKVKRSDPLAGAVNLGLCTVIDSKEARLGVRQLTVFPRGANDDVVDAWADGYNHITGGGWTSSLDELADLLCKASKE